MPEKPPKPFASFPLYAHKAGVWAKKIRGKTHYFGPWDDPQGALSRFHEQWGHLIAGRTRQAPVATVANLLDRFMDEKQKQLQTGDISRVTFQEYETTCVVIDLFFGKHRPAGELTVEDFHGLRVALAKGKKKAQLGHVTHKRRLTIARMVFAAQPLAHRKALKAPAKRLIRAATRARGELLYTSEEIRTLVEAAGPDIKAMILLGINCAFGPKDVCTLPVSAVDFGKGWHSYARPKTEVERRCPIWPETVDALVVVSDAARKGVHAGSKFIWPGWNRYTVASAFKKECVVQAIRNHGFYSLRRTFETVATTAPVSAAAVSYIMGHAQHDMASTYRQKIFELELTKCVSHVRAWYLGDLVLDG